MRQPPGRPPRPDQPPAPAVLATARALATDAACAEVVTSFDARGIGSILLKGATTAEWLYAQDVRPYVDADLLVAPAAFGDAAAVLRRLGFEPVEHFVSPHAHPWRRADGALIDLHHTIWGPHRPPEKVWDELGRWVEHRQIGSTGVRILNVPARALSIVLHAAQHRHDDKPFSREDLRRVLALVTLEEWQAAEMLADRLWALSDMAEGLSLEPQGRLVLERLPLAQAAERINRGGPQLTVGLARIAQARGVRGKLAVIARRAFPPAEDVGLGFEAPRVRLGVAYARRLCWLCGELVRALVASARSPRR